MKKAQLIMAAIAALVLGVSCSKDLDNKDNGSNTENNKTEEKAPGSYQLGEKTIEVGSATITGDEYVTVTLIPSAAGATGFYDFVFNSASRADDGQFHELKDLAKSFQIRSINEDNTSNVIMAGSNVVMNGEFDEKYAWEKGNPLCTYTGKVKISRNENKLSFIVKDCRLNLLLKSDKTKTVSINLDASYEGTIKSK